MMRRASQARPPACLPPSSPDCDVTTQSSHLTPGSGASILCHLQKRRLSKNGARGDSGGVPIDQLALGRPADHLVVFSLRHLQIRHPARQKEGVAATLRAFSGTTGSLAVRPRPRGIFRANPQLFIAPLTQMGNTRGPS